MTASNNDISKGRNVILGPREFMRARHPDLFSDTQVSDVRRFPRAVFEYHLDTVTSRKQEYQFEHFCRKLAEREICPNLRVQTGPTGGGDSKVDAETYPVADEIAERWWIGSAAAGTERWAFAFSAKKKWKPKVKADVDSILSTNRNYRRIYFFTNQFVSDKARSQQEDELSRYAGIPVHIMDRAWIVEKVYENGHVELAVAALGIEDVRGDKVNRAGPRDTERSAELEELDRQIADPSCYQDAQYQLAEDCLRSAILARGLERSRSEVEGRFALAYQRALTLNYPQQLLRITYNRAWTTYWWYEDYPTFNSLYDEVERHASGSAEADQIDLLVNLWMLLPTSVSVGRISSEDAKVESRKQRLVAMLEAVAADTARPNSALQARTALALMGLILACQTEPFDQLEAHCDELSRIVDESESLGDYPLERLSDSVAGMGGLIDSPAFDVLYEKIVDAIRRRRSDGEAGDAYADRGVQKLQQGKPYEAIQWLGRAEDLLYNEEYRAELVRTVVASSHAYECVGLLWAARNKALAAVERTLATFVKHGKMIRPTLLAVQGLAWVELRLGRISHALSAMNLADLVASRLRLSIDQQDEYVEQRQMQEAVLGIHFLNLSSEQLHDAARLPDALERLGLATARMALLFSLGQDRVLRDEGYIPVDEEPNAVQRFFEQWRDQPATQDIAPTPTLGAGATTLLRSTILGSELVVEAPNNVISLGVAESILGALEAFLATSDEDDVLPYRERTTIMIRSSDQLGGIPQFRFLDESDRIEIVHPTNLAIGTAVDRRDYMEWLRDSLIQIACRMLLIGDARSWIERLAGQERGFSRALVLGDALTLNNNVFGSEPRLHLADWLVPEDKEWAVLRAEPWEADKHHCPAGEQTELLAFGAGLPPEGVFDRTRLRHRDRRILSPIDVPVWDRAKWRGVMFACVPDMPPMLALIFEDAQAGAVIFRRWREQWGHTDEADELRVAIITGLCQQNPAEYAVIVGPNLCSARVKDEKSSVFISVSRIQRMVPASTANLDAFIAAYRRARAFVLAPAQLGTGTPTPFTDLTIAKRHLHIRRAWEISENDPDICALDSDDQPIIPEDVTDPPVTGALARIRARRRDDCGKPWDRCL